MWYYVREYGVPVVIVLVLVALFTALLAALVETSKAKQAEHDRLVRQCMDDGHKEYECESMLMKHEDTQLYPVVIPISTR